MQEEEREKRDNYCPEVSEVKTDDIVIDTVTSEMLKSIGMESLPGVVYRRPGEKGRSDKGRSQGPRRNQGNPNRYRPSARRQ